MIDKAVELYAQFLDLHRRPGLIASGRYYGMHLTYYEPVSGDYERFTKAMREHAMKLLTVQDDQDGCPTLRMGIDYSPEKDLLTVTNKLGMSVYGVFPCKSHVHITVYPNRVSLSYHLDAPCI